MKRMILLLGFAGIAVGTSGCAAIPLTTLGAGAFSAGANAAVRAGTEITRGGVLFKTFTLSQDQLRTAVGDTLLVMELAVIRDVLDEKGDRYIVATARDRAVEIELQPVTRTVTRLRLVVTEGTFRRDRATATEIMTQTERTVDERIKQATRETAASSLARGARR